MNVVLSRLKEIASAIVYAAEAPEIETVLERIATVAREIAQCNYAALGIPDGRGGLRYFKTSGMLPEDMAKMDHLPKGHGLIGEIMNQRESIRIEHIHKHEQSAGFPDNHPSMDRFLGVPIQFGNQLYGMLYLTDREDGQPFDENDQLMIETLAGYAGLAIASAEVNEQASRMRLLEERERIGMELHDGIIQSLYGIGMQVELLRLEDEIRSYQLEPVVNSLNDVIEDIRGYILDLRRRNKKATIAQMLREIPKRLHAPSTFEFVINAPELMPPFSASVFDSITLIASEAVSNAIRHSGGKTITISSIEENHIFSLIVEDDGHGFDVEHGLDKAGLGLRNMQHRARLFGGSVNIQSKSKQGTQLRIDIPIRAY